MFKNYLKTGLRNLWKNKTYGFLNIIGLAVGITCAALIFLWVEDEVTFDHQHKDIKRIGRIMEHQTYDGQTFTFGSSPIQLAEAMKNEVPGIEVTARTDWGNRKLFSLGDKAIYEAGAYIDSSFFKIFDFPFLQGNADKPFSELHSVVISEKMAKKFFGDANSAYGKMLKMNNDQEYVVSGVLKDFPQNSTIKFEWAAPFRIFEEKNPYFFNWGSNSVQTFAKISPNADFNKINKQLLGFIQTKAPDAIGRAFLFPMDQWRLYSKFQDGKQAGGRIEYVRLFTMIAWIILIIACINFMNLATARSEQRAREVGVRKVLGAGQPGLIRQFLSESVTLAFISVILAIGLTFIFLPGFNKLVDKDLSLNLFDPLHSLSLLAIGLICGLVAGSYPSLYLSSFSPIAVFKGLKIKGSTGAGIIRKGLVVAQFTISVVLIIGTIIIYQQTEHVKNRQLGYNKDHLIYMNLQGKMNEHFPAIHQQLMETGVVENASVSNQRLLQIGNNGDDFTWSGKDPNSHILITMEWVSPQYINTMGMQLLKGRDFGPVAENDSLSVIVNESFAKLLKKDDVIGETVRSNGLDLRIVGVVKDFVYGDMYAPAAPIVLMCQPTSVNYLFVRLKAKADLQGALAKVESVLKSNNPGYPFEYKFLDEEFNKLFKSEMLIGKLSRIFAILAIFISCLGLFGLAAYTAERKTKEIGIRKVLGASVGSVTALLSKNFLQLVIISLAIAFPLAWYFMHQWLQDFAYRIDINWIVFLIAGILSIFIAVFTISFQAIRAAIANPIKSLRSE